MNDFFKNDDTLVYVIDDDYKLIYFNDVLKKANSSLKIGDYCYEKLVNNKNICHNCPFRKKENKKKIFYNSFYNKWLLIDTANVSYNGVKGHLILANHLNGTESEYVANLVFHNKSDAIIELDLSSDDYYIVSSSINHVFPEEGKISELIINVIDTIIDKKEYTHFKKYTSNNNLIDALKKNSIVKEEFRLKNKIKSFEWIQVQIIPYEANDQLKAFCFVNLIDTKSNYKKKNTIFKDKLTNLYKGSDYLLMIKDYINNNPNNQFYLAAIDIEHFKMFNDWYGLSKGDDFLKDIATILADFDKKNNTFSGYFGSDDFCIILKKENDLINELYNKLNECSEKYSHGIGFTALIGVVEYSDDLSLSQLYDRACIAVSRTKGNYSHNICYYNDDMLLEMKNEHLIINEVMNGIKNREFVFFLQPQCNILTGKIFAAEALVRWKHDGKMIMPSYFIPVLEKTCTIVDLDKYLWEEVVKWQKDLINRGINPIPISVNVSRIDLLYLDVADFFIALVEKYDISPSYIEIEITESTYIEGVDKINFTVEKLKNYGFKILMDDFGSGYSSLNMLKNVNIDILKMDMKFLDLNDDKNDKGINILESVVSMVKTLNLPFIMEGVETEYQVEALKDMGCQYAQGYHFYKPMPISDFEQITYKNNNFSYDNIISKKVEQVRVRDLLNENLYSDTLVNNILGAIGFFAVHDDEIELIKVNEQYNRLFGEISYLDPSYRENIMNYFYKEDIPLVKELFMEAYKNSLHGSCKDVRYIKENKTIWLHVRAYYLNDSDNKKIYYCSFEDITLSKEIDLEIKLLNEKLQTTLKLEKIDSWEYNVKTKQLTLFSSNTDVLSTFINDGIVLSDFPYCLLKNHIISSTEYLIMQKYINRAINGYYKDKEKYVCELPFNINDNNIWLRIVGKPIYNNDEVVLLIGSYKDITENMKVLQNTNNTLNLLNDTSSFAIFLNVTQNIIYNTKSVGDYRLFDYIDEKDYDIFIQYLSNNSIYQDDLNRFVNEIQRKNMLEKYSNGESFISIEYRSLINNQISWKRLFIYLFEQNNDLYAHMYIINIDKLKKQQMELYLNNSSIDESICGVLRINKDTKEVVEVNDAAVEIFDYSSKQELINHFTDGLCDRIYDGDRNFMLDNQKNLKKVGDSHTFEYRILLNNGEYRYLNAFEILYENANHELFIQRTVMDNTANKRLELELIKDNSHKEMTELKFSYENKAILVGLNKLFIASYYCNIADNTYYSMKHTDAVNDLINNNPKFDDFMQGYLETYVYEEDKAKFKDISNRSNIKKIITRENERYSFPFRRITSDGYKWLNMNIIASSFDFNSNVENIILGISDVSDDVLEKQKYIYQIDYYKDLLFNACKAIYLDVVQINLDNLEGTKVYFNQGNINEHKLSNNWSIVKHTFVALIDDEYKEQMSNYLDENILRNLPVGYSNSYRYKLYLTDNKLDYSWISTTIKITERNNIRYANLYSINVTDEVKELEAAKEKSAIDGLTGLLNRRMFEIWCKEESMNYDSYAVLFLDINGLKGINDTMGHNLGDYAIVTCANAIKSITNNDVKAYRYGGDEFIIIAVNKTKNEIDEIVKNFNHCLWELCVDKNIDCNVSIGVSFASKNDSIYDIILKADQEMYINKNLNKRIKSFNSNDSKIASLIKFLDSEFISIYEIDLENDTYEVIQNNGSTAVNFTDKGCYSKMSAAMIMATTKPEYVEERMIISSINYLKENLVIQNHIEFEYETTVVKNAKAITIFQGCEYEGGKVKKAIMANKRGFRKM